MSTEIHGALPPELLAAYQEACHVQGQHLEVFFEEVRDRFDGEALIALLDRVEEDIQENISMVLQANPDIEELAVTRANAQRKRIAILREEVQ